MEPLDSGIVARLKVHQRRPQPMPPPRPPITPPKPKPEGEAPIPRRILNRVLHAVSVAWECDADQILGQWRPARIIGPRFATYRLFQESTQLTWQAMADYLERDRGTVREGLHRAEQLHETDLAWRSRYHAARAALQLGCAS